MVEIYQLLRKGQAIEEYEMWFKKNKVNLSVTDVQNLQKNIDNRKFVNSKIDGRYKECLNILIHSKENIFTIKNLIIFFTPIVSIKKDFMVSSRLINFVFGFFPISFILGNFIINLNVLLFCCLGIFQLRSKILKTKLNFPLKIIFLLFIFIIFSTSLNFIQSLILDEYININSINLIKSIFFFRFFFSIINCISFK